MSATLSDRQELFVHQYLIDLNASAAARRAGYSAKSRGAQAAGLMKNPLVRERIRLGLQDMYAELRISALGILKAQSRIAFFDPAKLFDAQGEPVPLDQLDEDTASVLLVSYDTRSNGDLVRRVRQPARHIALAALEKRYAQFMQLQMEWLRAPQAEEDEDVEEAGEAGEAAMQEQPAPAADMRTAPTAEASVRGAPPPINVARPTPALHAVPPPRPYVPNPRLGSTSLPQPPAGPRFAPSPLAAMLERCRAPDALSELALAA